MSGLAAVAVLGAGAPTWAAEPPPAAVAAKRADDLDARHHFGFQVGGSSFAQVSYRLRMFGHVYLDVGVGGAPHGVMNGSAGLVVARSTGTRVFPYAGGGVGFGVLAGPGDLSGHPDGECNYGGSGCPWDDRSVTYGYGRAGVGVMLDEARRLSLLLDMGVWVGTKWRSRGDGMGMETNTRQRFVWPMPGLAGFVSF
jgi:hypothetical protein